MWHEKTAAARRSGELVVLGVIQEQHPDRCRLFAQWHGIEWPILHDPFNQLQNRAVPIFVAIDKSGVVVDSSFRTNELDAFLKSTPAETSVPAATARPDVASLKADPMSAYELQRAADTRLLWHDSSHLSAAIDEYERAVKLRPKSAATHFRLGVAYRMRFDSRHAHDSDFASAIDSWSQALKLDPNHYIFRRRIQQYGPRLMKPYPFYDWVKTARAAIQARGDVPHPLVVEPGGAEIAAPERKFSSETSEQKNPDPDGKITRDSNSMIKVSAVFVPNRIPPKGTVRVHVQFTPSKSVHWNNEAEPMVAWIETPTGWSTNKQLLTAAQPKTAESRETRTLEFELNSSAADRSGSLNGFALYYICEESGGQCLYRRQDFRITMPTADNQK